MFLVLNVKSKGLIFGKKSVLSLEFVYRSRLIMLDEREGGEKGEREKEWKYGWKY